MLQREDEFKAQDREREMRGRQRERCQSILQRCHVIESMVQLLTNGLVLQLLSIQFIWKSEVDRKYRQVFRDSSDTNKPRAG